MATSSLTDLYKRITKTINIFSKISEKDFLDFYELNKNNLELLNDGLNKKNLNALNEILYNRYKGNSDYSEIENKLSHNDYYYNLVQISKLNLKIESKDEFKKIYERSINSNGFDYYKRFRVDFYDHLEGFSLSNEEMYILALAQFVVAEMLFLMTVKFVPDYERKVAHYTNIDVARLIIHDQTKFRLNSTEKMNDPSEGKLIFEYLGLKLKEGYRPLLTFLSCFTLNHNSLNHFRLYGKTNEIDCSGVSLVVNEDFFHKYAVNSVKINSKNKNNKLSLYRCGYIDINTGYFELSKRNKFSFFQEYQDLKVSEIEDKWEKYTKIINRSENMLKTSIEDLKNLCDYCRERNLNLDEILGIIFQPLKFLFKHFAFQEEQECRIIYVSELNDDIVVYDYETNLTYINYEYNMVDSLKNIYVGKAAEKIFTPLSIEVSKISDKIKVRLLDAPFRVNKELNKLVKIEKNPL